MDDFINNLKRHMVAMDRQIAHPGYGIVQSYNPANGTARVLMQPDNILTGWLPVSVAWLGNGWGLMCPPSPGDQVVVAPQGGSADDMIIMGVIAAPQGGVIPPATPSGELWMVHQSGAFIKLLNNGGIVSNGTWSHTGEFTATGAIIAGFGGSDQVGVQTHTHHQPNDSAGNTEQPTNAPTAGT